jgi:hypothetical protein
LLRDVSASGAGTKEPNVFQKRRGSGINDACVFAISMKAAIAFPE